MPVEILRPGCHDGLDHRASRQTFRFPAERAAVGPARRQVRGTLDRWGLEEVGDNAGLVVTELFANAIKHTASEHVEISLWTSGRMLYVEVIDQGGTDSRPVARTAYADSESGRGLMLVAQLSQQWGVRPPSPDRGRAVWAAMSFIPPDG